MTVTFLWEDGNYDQYAAPVVHPNGDTYIVTKRPSSITVSMVKSGTGELNNNIHIFRKGADYINAGYVDLALHPAGHIIVGGTFITVAGDWSPGYLIAHNKVPTFNPNQNFTVVTSANDAEARRLAQNAINVSNGALGVLNSVKAEVNTNGANVERKANDTINKYIADATKKIDAKLANLQPVNVNQLVADTVWSKVPDRIWVELENANSPLRQTMIQTAQADNAALRAELKKTQEQLEYISKYFHDQLEALKKQPR